MTAEHADTEAWIAELTPKQIMAGISRALKARDWLAVEGLMKLLAIKDPESAQTIYDVLTVVAGRKERGHG